jgi:GNAT superfamily N-acetyltransferase
MLEVQLLDKNIHDRNQFDCGVSQLNSYLKEQATQSSKRLLSKTYVFTDDIIPSEIIGYFTLNYCEVNPPQNSKLSKYPYTLPALKLSKLAVSTKFKGHRFGEQLLLYIISLAVKTTQSDSTAPVIGLFVDAIDKDVREFYTKYGFFEVSTEAPLSLYLPISDCVKVEIEMKGI